MGKFSIGTFVKPEAENEWVEDVTELAEATAQDANAAATFVINVKEEGKTLRAIREAAKTLDKTVRIRHRDDSNVAREGVKENGKPIFGGEVIITISLTDKYKDGRGRKPASESADAPEGKSKGK